MRKKLTKAEFAKFEEILIAENKILPRKTNSKSIDNPFADAARRAMESQQKNAMPLVQGKRDAEAAKRKSKKHGVDPGERKKDGGK